MNAVLPLSPAKEYCLQWMESLEKGGAEEGCMLGILVCTDGTVLRAFSGLHASLMGKEGYVTPCFNPDEYNRISSLSTSDAAFSREVWKRLLSLYEFHCFDGKTVRLEEIFPDAPSGTGDCCAPRLLSRCYALGKKPLSMAEFYWGDGPFERASFHSPCDSRCKPVLRYILGLDIVYMDSDIVVVNKPHGLLSIEGKTEKDCVASRVRNLFPSCIKQPCIHRLDQATSGLIVLGLTDRAHDTLSSAFEKREVLKEYTALIDGVLTGEEGEIDMSIRADIENRPIQIPDPVLGKKAVTRWKRIRVEKAGGRFVTRILLRPLTGRTHQIRVHCACGLGMPVLHDRLYGGENERETTENLCLCASKLVFDHPVSGQMMSFEVEPDF